ncbi:MAG TPA: hypothetical protein DCK78_13485 [Paenibacillus lactis]|nr:hypothetical protein [Paenibacillus lactis]
MGSAFCSLTYYLLQLVLKPEDLLAQWAPKPLESLEGFYSKLLHMVSSSRPGELYMPAKPMPCGAFYNLS